MLQESQTNTPAQESSVSITDGSMFESPEGIMDGMVNLWNTHLFNLNDTAITVSKLAIALLVLLIGVAIAKMISNRIGQKILPRMKVNQGAANALQSILYYALLTITVLLALQIAGVPLTALAFFGGAIALGFGFGSQNVINNFISGLIVLIERPVGVGDLVTINGQQGCVVAVGARATKLESYMGVTYIVPNSTILESAVTNWSLPTASIKTVISVGVAYGSDTAKVRSLLEGVMNEHSMVSDSKENTIMFVNFGDSSLDFEIHCRISPKSVQEAKTFESDIRLSIDEVFREQGIEIPFPQRDLHVKTGMS